MAQIDSLSALSQLSLKRALHERRYLVAAVGSWVVMAVLIALLVIPQVRAALDTKNQLDSKKETLSKLENKMQFLQNFKQDEFVKLSVSVARVLPSSKPFLPLLFSLEQLSQNQQVVFTGLTISPGDIGTDSAKLTTTGGLQQIPFDIQILGTSTNINGFLDKLNSVAPALDVQTFSLTPKKSGGKTATAPSAPGTPEGQTEDLYEAKIKVMVLYAPTGKVTVDTTQPLPKLSADEEDYLQTGFRAYTLFTPAATAPAPGSTGKDDPFAL